MALLAGQQADPVRQRQFNLDAARALAAIRAWPDLTTVLANLGSSEGPEATAFLGQALWLAFRVHVPVEVSLTLASFLFRKVGAASAAAPALAWAACFLVTTRGEHHHQQRELNQQAAGLLAESATARQVPEDQFQEWLVGEGLNDPQRMLQAVDGVVEELVGDTPWLFDRAQVGQS
jgi:hypothetical protein